MRPLRVVLSTVAVAALTLSAAAASAPGAAQATTPDTTGPGVQTQKTQFDLQAHRGGIGMTTEESLPGFARPSASG